MSIQTNRTQSGQPGGTSPEYLDPGDDPQEGGSWGVKQWSRSILAYCEVYNIQRTTVQEHEQTKARLCAVYQTSGWKQASVAKLLSDSCVIRRKA